MGIIENMENILILSPLCSYLSVMGIILGWNMEFT
jgi:hypothetical protein